MTLVDDYVASELKATLPWEILFAAAVLTLFLLILIVFLLNSQNLKNRRW